MKKKIIIGIVIAIILLLLIPIPKYFNDGGSIEFKAILYTITKYHKINENSETGYIDGIGIKILGKEMYNNVKSDISSIKETDEKQNKISKLSQMYITMIEDIMAFDQELESNVKFIAIDFSNFRRPLTEKEKAEKYNMPNFNTKEEKEEWERQIKSKPIEEETKQEMVEYLKAKYSSVEIKQITYEELVQQELATKDEGIKEGVIIYVSALPEIIEENKAKIELTKYRGPLGANFNEYEMKYKNNEWQLKIISQAIS